ncbi:MAG: HAMP domain-containing sensor histidine kinase, partial [Vicinamibacterales bacterium]
LAMSSADDTPVRLSGSFGLRLAVWYAVLFVVSSFAVVLITYVLTSSSLAQRDQEIIQSKLGEYATVYARGGLRALTATIEIEQRTSSERIFVRVLAGASEAVVTSNAEGWDPARLEVGAVSLLDGTIVQVGRSTESRAEILGRFRASLGLVTLSIIVIALTGGWVLTQSALQPIHRLTSAVRRIIATGRTDERVPPGTDADAINELTLLFNAMLDRIEALVRGMRGALDNVSHDLRTPLTHLRGTAELALASPPDGARDREALADCVEESDRVLVMLNTLMDISEAESGAMLLRRELCDLSDLVRRALDLYHEVADAKGVSLEAGALSAVQVLADPVRIQQVAANLIDNAVKYTPEGGRVTVDVDTVGDVAVLRVRDTGQGIAASELPRIWDRLFRGDRSRHERGLGLGLSLVRAIVVAHGGTVDVTSSLGHGSTFTVTLPRSVGR